MSLSDLQKIEISNLVEKSLDDAEAVWSVHGKDLVLKSIPTMDSDFISAHSISEETVPSRIPNHPIVKSGKPIIGEFIALTADMRKSSEHLLCAISPKIASVSELQRVYYETSALLPALEKTVTYEGGAVTEYLGDGVLALFTVEDDTRGDQIKSAYWAAKNCIGDTRAIINNAIKARYNLPQIDLGVGLSFSRALVQLVGIEGTRHPKVVGNCVYYASKLSAGVNQIFADGTIHQLWPTSKGGKLQFIEKSIRGTKGFLISPKLDD